MEDPKYVNIGSPEYRVVEECSELTKEIMKALRFGWFNFHPDEPDIFNIDRIRREMEDLNNAMAKLDSYLRNIQTEHYKAQLIQELAAEGEA